MVNVGVGFRRPLVLDASGRAQFHYSHNIDRVSIFAANLDMHPHEISACDISDVVLEPNSDGYSSS